MYNDCTLTGLPVFGKKQWERCGNKKAVSCMHLCANLLTYFIPVPTTIPHNYVSTGEQDYSGRCDCIV